MILGEETVRKNVSRSVTLFGVYVVWVIAATIWAIILVLLMLIDLIGFWSSDEFDYDPDPPRGKESDPSQGRSSSCGIV